MRGFGVWRGSGLMWGWGGLGGFGVPPKKDAFPYKAVLGCNRGVGGILGCSGVLAVLGCPFNPSPLPRECLTPSGAFGGGVMGFWGALEGLEVQWGGQGCCGSFRVPP